MRLARLDLTRYGRFTDRVIDFGPSVPGRPDLHVVYGPNEAGKSTTLSAILDLLFEMEVQSGYGFLHNYKSMAVGARIDTDAGSWEAVRVKRRNDSLVDPSGGPLDAGFLATALAGLDRDGYRLMFSLDDATLEQGGEAILASRGDLGKVLFSATAGLAELNDTIVSIRSEADAFHRFRARSGVLTTLKGRLDELRRRKNDVDTVATQHARLVAERADAQRVHEGARVARMSARRQATAHRDLLGALPHFARIASVRCELEGLASLPEAPASWADELPALQREEVEVATKLDGLEAKAAALEERVGGIVVDDGALSVADQVGRLPGLRTRHSDALDALPDARAQLSTEVEAVAGILRELGRPVDADPRALLLPSPLLAVLGDLMERRSGVVEALRKSRDDVARGEAAVADALEELGEWPAEAAPTEAAAAKAIRSAADVARRGGHEALVASARRAVERRQAQLSDALLGLRPWEGDLGRLAVMVTPAPPDVEAWRTELAEAMAEAAEAADRVSRLEEDWTRLRVEAAAASAALGCSSSDPVAARGDRERAWAKHRSDLDHASADAFEHAMRLDDSVTSARVGQAAELSRLGQLRERVDEASAAIERVACSREQALARAGDVRARVAAAAVASAGAWDDSVTPAWLERWLSRRSAALDLGVELADAEAEARNASEAAEVARVALARALAAATVPHDPEAGVEGLTGLAQAFLDEQSSLAGRRRRLADLGRDLAGYRRSLEVAAADEEEWRGEWDRACGRCWIGREAGVVEVRTILDGLARLGPRVDEHRRLVIEVRDLERDVTAFVDEVARLAPLVSCVDVGASPAEASRRLEEAARLAVAARDGLVAAQAELDATRAELDALRAASVTLEARKRAMTSLLRVETLAEVGERLASIGRRRDLRAQLDLAGRDVVQALGAASLAEAEALLRDLDREELRTRLLEAEVFLEGCERAEGEAYAALRKAADRLDEIGGDEEVARIAEERSTILLEIEERAASCLRLRLGVLAAEAAIDMFRDEHAGGLMAAASEAFTALTAGAYVKLTSRSERTGETLIALTGTGASRTAAEMSKGTRFQLYLALRIAAYKQYVRSRPAVPFVADDILETFDDHRTREAIEAFADMGMDGQVIYLTHHPHVCRIAARVCPDVRIHELEPLPVG